MSAPRLNGPFKYRSSVDTDIRRTFKRIERERAAAKEAEAAAASSAHAAAPVVAMVPAGRKAAR